MNRGRRGGVLAKLTGRPHTRSSISGDATRGDHRSRGKGRVVRGCVLALVTIAALAAAEEPWKTSFSRFPATGATAKVSERANNGASRREGHRLAFESNEGQIDASVRFEAKGAGFAIRLSDRGATLRLRGAYTGDPDLVLGLQVADSPGVDPVATEPLRGRSSYLRGRTQASWVRDVPHFARVTYPSARPGVDLVFHGEEGQLEYDFIIAPGAPIEAAQLEISGADALSLDDTGALLVHTRRGVLRQPPPTVYQDDAFGSRHQVRAGYRLAGGTRLAFAITERDETRPLVIDPVLVYSGYLGGSGFDVANAVAVDGSGNVYIAGFTTSFDFPLKDGVQGAIGGSTDIFVAKLDPEGQELLYSTYLGGSAEDAAYGIAVDETGSAYVTGNTESSDFPVVPSEPEAGPCPVLQCENGGASNAFVAKLDPNGNALVYSTYLGGSGYDAAQGIAIDALGNAYVAGFTQSSDFPTISPFQSTLLGTQNAFVAKLSPSGTTLLGSTYLGGSENDAASGIAVDALGDVYVAGYTQSVDFHTKHAFQKVLQGTQNAFATELAPSFDTLTFSTYLGGSGSDTANAIALDASGDLFLAGASTSADFPVQGPYQSSNAGHQDAFVAEIAAGGSSLVYSTFLGGSGTDLASALAIDPSGAAFVVGQTQSVNFPIRGAFQSNNAAPPAADGNAFVSILDPTGRQLMGSSYLGGKGGARAQAVALGAGDAAWVVGGAGAGLPTRDALHATYAAQSTNGQNAFLALVSPDAGSEAGADGGVTSDDGPEGGPESGAHASKGDGGPTVVVVVTPLETATPDTTPSGGGCHMAEGRGGPPTLFGGGLLLGVLSGRRRRSRTARRP